MENTKEKKDQLQKCKENVYSEESFMNEMKHFSTKERSEMNLWSFAVSL